MMNYELISYGRKGFQRTNMSGRDNRLERVQGPSSTPSHSAVMNGTIALNLGWIGLCIVNYYIYE